MADHKRILTTHAGSLPRPHDLLDMMKVKLSGKPYDKPAYDARVSKAVAEVLKKQAEVGLDIVSDGETSKPGFFSYVRDRLTGFEPRPGKGPKKFRTEIEAFPEYYEAYFKRAMTGGAVAPIVPMVCTGPITYRGHDALAADIANMKAAVAGISCVGAFMPATAPSGVGTNDFYKTEEEFFHALGEALRTEYLAIVAAGFTLQVDDPYLSEIFADPAQDAAKKKRTADIFVESVNHSLRGIAPENIRFHTCYGINDGPRVHEANLADVVGHMLKVNAAAYSFEAANCRHEHEYHLWETVKLPAGKALIPGVITHASNIVEHPELIAERLTRFAKLVGRENVIAGADCGFSSQASYNHEVHPTVMWAKFQSMAQGAAIASKRLW